MTDKSSTALETRDVEDGRMHSPSAGRNKAIIAKFLADILPQNAHVLEIASGTGEHGHACVQARPDLHWQPSDRDEQSRRSIDAWSSDTQGSMLKALDLDVTRTDWHVGPDRYDTIFCANMIHIAPWTAAEGLLHGARKLVRDEGYLIFYGPFLLGDKTAPSNLAFDDSLKSRNPAWGVRSLDEVERLCRSEGFELTDRIDMPANNLILVFRKSSSS